MRIRIRGMVLLGLLVSCAGTRVGEGAETPGSYARYRLVLNEAGEDGRPLVLSLHSRDGIPSTGWACVGHDTGFVNAHDLRRFGDVVRGHVSVEVGALQYACNLAARAVGDTLVGSFVGRRGVVGAVEGVAGAATGRLSSHAEGGDFRVTLHLWSMYTQFGHIRNPDVQAVVRGGEIRDGTFEFGRNPENRGKLEGGHLRVEGARLVGAVRATVLAGDAAAGTYTFSMDVPVRSSFLEGTYQTTHDGRDWGAHGLSGEVWGLRDPGNGGVLVLSLTGGIEGERPLTVYLERDGEGFPTGMARGGNLAFHEVDARGLRITKRGVSGPIRVSVRPDGAYPPGRRAVTCEYSVNAAWDESHALVGAFCGRYGVQTEVQGELTGGMESPPPEGGSGTQGWPSLAGPFGTFLSDATSPPLVDDLSRVTIAWVSECADLGIGKQGTPFPKSFQSGTLVRKYLGREAANHPGSWAGVIVGDGKVFASSFRPTGAFFECDFPDGNPAEVRVDAEDIVVAMDFRTGRTLWIAAEPGGILTGGGKRAGFQVAPVYRDGRVFSMGSTGRLFAYQAGSGKKVWQAHIGEAHQRLEAERREVLDGLNRRRFSYPKSPAWHTSLTVAGDTLIVPTFVKGTLRGLDAATGTTRWEAEGVGSHLVTPSIWRHGGREYVLTANTSGAMRLLDPRDGRELWKVDGLGGSYFTLSPSEGHVLVNVNPESGKAPGGKRISGFLGAYRITPTEATRAWAMPFEPRNGLDCWMDSEARYRYTVRDGLVYLYTGGAGQEAPGRFVVLREDTGAVVAEHSNAGDEADRIGGLWYLVGDKIIARWDASHGPRHGGRHPWRLWRISGSRIERLPGSLDKNEFTNGYEVHMEHPVVAGFLLERSEDGRVVCYDLRSRE